MWIISPRRLTGPVCGRVFLATSRFPIRIATDRFNRSGARPNVCRHRVARAGAKRSVMKPVLLALAALCATSALGVSAASPVLWEADELDALLDAREPVLQNQFQFRITGAEPVTFASVAT